MINCSLIVSTYNWPEALIACLESVKRQTHIPAEIMIADDGSGEETLKVVEKYKQEKILNIVHIFQPDNGFRLGQIRNKAIAASTNPYIIQIDGDVVLHSKFVEDHLATAQKNCLVQGSRVMLGPTISKKLLNNPNYSISILSGDISRRENGIRWPWFSRYLQTKYRNRYPLYWARGANMSFWRKDLIEVNGYNEDFIGWGDEDSELTLRLLNAGKNKLYLKFAGVIYHIYHKEDSSKATSINKQLLQQTFDKKLVKIKNGIDKYLKQ